AQSESSTGREHGELRASVDKRVGFAGIEPDREKQMVAPRPTRADSGIGLFPGRRSIRAGLLSVKDHAVSRQVEIDVKTAQGVRPQQSIKWPREHARHIDRSNANSAPRYSYTTEAEAAQLRLATLHASVNPAQLPLKFDARAFAPIR